MHILKIEGVSKTFKEQVILENVNVIFESGKIYGITGANGTGKTLLLKLISQLITIDQGTITYDGEIVSKQNIPKLNVGISLEKTNLIEELTIIENLKFLSSFRKLVNEEEILELLKEFKIENLKNQIVKKLSLGTKQKVSIIQALMENPKIILLDEVSNSLDRDSLKILHYRLKQEKELDKIIIYVSHNFEELIKISDEIYEVHNREVIQCSNLSGQ